MHTALLREGDRDGLVTALRARGIGASVHFDPPLHRHPAYAEAAASALPVTERVARSILTLPIYPGMTAAERERVTSAVRDLPG